MVRSTYFFYLFLLNALINLVNFVPRTLIQDRFHGSVMSLIIALPIGLSLMLLFARMISKFPQQGLPEIMSRFLPKWVAKALLIVMGSIWFMSSILTLVGFLDMTNRYISPDVSPFVVLVGFLLVVGLSARLDSESILYGLEIVLYMTVPLIVYMVWRVFSSPFYSWDASKQVITYLWERPKYQALASATYVFTGYINMTIFNRVFEKLRIRHIWLFFIVGLCTLVIAMFSSIGFLGAEGADQHVYPSFSTVDSLRIRYFIIERMIYVFYVVYMCLSLVNSIIHWHVAKELLMGVFSKASVHVPNDSKNIKKRQKTEWWILAVFSCIVYAFALTLDQFTMTQMGIIFLNVRFAGEFILLGLMFYLVMQRRKRV
ncbi:Spore germination protein [Paenibacillus uliginis N3/975]|uniref:Spore germination protein n=1 Tax=Paenibacillus uliginis N3/975 TaxID=1313296 RepID=A0A1X7G956_9BACL|nr:GerAB/ArcD/ProY family transporter [Paenibacillus uliginis]SMF66145.1 Spore germination protein [Paenibacillus uliginis N3/975]